MIRQAPHFRFLFTRRISLAFFVLLLAIAGISPSAFSLNLPSSPVTYVSDFAKTLSPASRADLENQLAQFEQKTSNQVLVVTLSDLQGVPIEDWGIQLAEKWKPGQKDRHNGVILLVAPQDRAVRIEVGYGLEGALTDAQSRRIIQNEIIPEFRQGRFNEGVTKGARAILQTISGEYQGRGPQPDSVNWLHVAILTFIFLLWMINPRARRAITLGALGSGILGGGGGGYRGNSGGFSSGGGSFGGGGASGKW